MTMTNIDIFQLLSLCLHVTVGINDIYDYDGKMKHYGLLQ